MSEDYAVRRFDRTEANSERLQAQSLAAVDCRSEIAFELATLHVIVDHLRLLEEYAAMRCVDSAINQLEKAYRYMETSLDGDQNKSAELLEDKPNRFAKRWD